MPTWWLLFVITLLAGSAHGETNERIAPYEGNWSDPSLWIASTPAAGEQIYIRGDGTSRSSFVVSLATTTEEIADLDIGFDDDDTHRQVLVIQDGGLLRYTTDLRIRRTGVIRVEEGGVLFVGTSSMTVNGRLEMAGGTLIGAHAVSHVNSGGVLAFVASSSATSAVFDKQSVEMDAGAVCLWEGGDVVLRDSSPATPPLATVFKLNSGATMVVTAVNGTFRHSLPNHQSSLQFNGLFNATVDVNLKLPVEVGAGGQVAVSHDAIVRASDDVAVKGARGIVLEGNGTFQVEDGVLAMGAGSSVNGPATSTIRILDTAGLQAVSGLSHVDGTVVKVDGGFIGGTGTMNVTGPLVWNSGRMQDAGQTIVGGPLSGSGDCSISRRNLIIAPGNDVDLDGEVSMDGGARITVPTTAALTLPSGAHLRGSACTVDVAGHLEMQGATVECASPVSGTVALTSGRNDVSGGGHQTGAWTMHPLTEAAFTGGDWDFAPSSSLTGSGTTSVEVGGTGDVTFAAASTFEATTVSVIEDGSLRLLGGRTVEAVLVLESLEVGGTAALSTTRDVNTTAFNATGGGTTSLEDGAVLTVGSGGADWRGGKVAGTGTLAVPADSFLHVTVPTAGMSLDTATVAIDGPVEWRSDAPGAALTVRDGTILTRATSAVTFVEQGTILLDGDATTTSSVWDNAGNVTFQAVDDSRIEVPISNTGIIVVEGPGDVSFYGGGTHAGVLSLPATGATSAVNFESRGAPYVLTAASVVEGNGTVRLGAGAVVNAQGEWRVDNLEIGHGASLVHTGPNALDVLSLAVSGGSMSTPFNVSAESLVLDGANLAFTGAGEGQLLVESSAAVTGPASLQGFSLAVAPLASLALSGNNTDLSADHGVSFAPSSSLTAAEGTVATLGSRDGELALANIALASHAEIGLLNASHFPGGDVELAEGSRLVLGALTSVNAATVTIAGAGTLALAPGATLVFDGVSAGDLLPFNASLDNAGTIALVNGTLTLARGGQSSGIINVTSPAVLTLASSPSFTMAPSSWVGGTGTAVHDAGSMTILQGTYLLGINLTAPGAAVRVDEGADVQVPYLVLAGSDVEVGGDGVVQVADSFVWTAGSALSDVGAPIHVLPGASATISGPAPKSLSREVRVSGTANVTSAIEVAAPGAIRAARGGVVTAVGASPALIGECMGSSPPAILVDDGGRFEVASKGNCELRCLSVHTEGVVDMQNGSSLTLADGGEVSQQGSSSSLRVGAEATLTAMLVRASAGVVEGSGTLSGTAMLHSDAVLSPGFPSTTDFDPEAGLFTIVNGNLSIVDAATLRVDVLGGAVSPRSDQVMVMGGHVNMTKGLLRPDYGDALVAEVDDRFPIFQYGGATSTLVAVSPVDRTVPFYAELQAGETQADLVFLPPTTYYERGAGTCFEEHQLWDEPTHRCVCVFGYTGRKCDINAMALGLGISLGVSGLAVGTFVGLRLLKSRADGRVSPTPNDDAMHAVVPEGKVEANGVSNGVANGGSPA